MSRERFSRGVLEVRFRCGRRFRGSGSSGSLDSGWLSPESRFSDPGPRIPALWAPDPGHVGLKLAQDGLMLAPSWPRDAQNGLPRPPRCLKNASGRPQDDLKVVFLKSVCGERKNASGRPQDDLKIKNFEVFVRKTRKCVWSYYSNVFSIFWEVFFHRFLA